MDAKQESQFNMHRTVHQFLTNADNAVIVATVPALAPLVTLLGDRNGKITAAIVLQGIPIGGVSTDKGDLKRDMCKITSKLGKAGCSYARKMGDDTLHAKLNFSFSDLYKERDDEAGPRCAGILIALNSVAAALVDYGVTAIKLTACGTAIENYIAAVPSVRTAEVSKSVETDKLVTLLHDNSFMLSEEVDGVIQLMEDDEPDFVSGYFKSRILIDPQHFSTAFLVNVFDEESDLEIGGAVLNITDTGDEIIGNAAGIILWKPAVQGDHPYSIGAPGYVTKTGNVHLTLGAETVLEVALMKAP